MRSRGLNPKHKKALELLQQGKLKISEVAKESGLSTDHLYDLLSGAEKAGGVAQEFSTMYAKVMEDTDKRINAKQKELKEVVTEVLSKWSKENSKKKLTESELKGFVNTAKVLQTGPVYNIGSVSYSRGLTSEEMSNEFKRLRALAESALGRKAVQGAVREGSGVLSSSVGRGNQDEDGEEDTSLRPEPKARRIS